MNTTLFKDCQLLYHLQLESCKFGDMIACLRSMASKVCGECSVKAWTHLNQNMVISRLRWSVTKTVKSKGLTGCILVRLDLAGNAVSPLSTPDLCLIRIEKKNEQRTSSPNRFTVNILTSEQELSLSWVNSSRFLPLWVCQKSNLCQPVIGSKWV